MIAKDFAGIPAARIFALALLLSLLHLSLPRTCAAAQTADASAQHSTNHANARPKKRSQPGRSRFVVRKASDGSSVNTAVAKGKRSSSRKKKYSRTRGQQKIDSGRALAIQQALIREHYLNGAATGTWNQASEEAMRRYQSDHGWQSKTVPDSRALISLGLGPSNDHLLNPESAAVAGPNTPRAASLAPVSHSADPEPPASKTPTTLPAPASTSNQDVSRPQ